MLNIDQIQVYKDRRENADLMDGSVPDAGVDDGTARTHSDNTVNREQRDWVTIVENRLWLWHRSLSSGESKRFFRDDSKKVGSRRGVRRDCQRITFQIVILC